MAMSSSADAPAKKEKDPDQRRVTIWNRAQGRKIAGNAAPLSRNLEEYLRKHPHCEKYDGQDRATRYTAHRKILPVGAPAPVRTIPLAYPVGVPMQPGMDFATAGAMQQRQVQMMLFNQQQAQQAFAAHIQMQQQVAQQQIQMQAEAQVQARHQAQARAAQARVQAQARAQAAEAEAQARAQAAAHAQAQEFSRAAREQAEQQERLQNEAKAAAHLQLVQSFQAEMEQQQNVKTFTAKDLHPSGEKDDNLAKTEMPPPPPQQPQSPLGGMSDEQFRLFMDQQQLSALMQQQQRDGDGNAPRANGLLPFGPNVDADRAVAVATNALAETSIGDSQAAATMNGVVAKGLPTHTGRSMPMSGGMSHARKPQRVPLSLTSPRGPRASSQIAMGAQQSSKHLDDNDARVDSALVDKVDKALFSDPPLDVTVGNKHASGVLTLPRSISRTLNGRAPLPGAISQSFSFMRQSRDSLMEFRRRDMSIEAMRVQGRDLSMEFGLSRRLGSRDPSMESNLVRDMSIEFGPNALGPNFGTPFKLPRELSVDMQMLAPGPSAPRGATLQQGALSEEVAGGTLDIAGNATGWGTTAAHADVNTAAQPGPRIGRAARAAGMSSDDLSLVMNSAANHNLYRYAPCGSIEDFYEIRHPF